MAAIELGGAYEAVAQHARLAEVTSLARAVLGEAAAARRPEVHDGPRVIALAAELHLSADDAKTSYGNVLDVFSRAPENDAERALAGALAAHWLAEAPRESAADEDRLASDFLWLASHSAFDGTLLVDRALGDGAGEFWDAIAARVKKAETQSNGSRAEVFPGLLALYASREDAARRALDKLGDIALASHLGPKTPGVAPNDTPAVGPVAGEIEAAPRGPFATTLLALTGLVLVIRGARLVARHALALRRPAELEVRPEGVRVTTKTLLLGRVLREREIVLPHANLARAIREVRYARIPFFAGLFALLAGSYVGVWLFVDGVRSASPSLLAWGLGIAAVSVAVEVVLSTVSPSVRGETRLVFETTKGNTCVGRVPADRATALLERLRLAIAK